MLLNIKGFIFLMILSQVIMPGQVNYYFFDVPAQVKDFGLYDSLWNILYVELWCIGFALVCSVLIKVYDTVNARSKLV